MMNAILDKMEDHREQMQSCRSFSVNGLGMTDVRSKESKGGI